MVAKDRQHAAHALLTAASRFDASGADNLDIVLEYPLMTIDLAIINNHLEAKSEIPPRGNDITVKLPFFSCPERVLAIGRESGMLMTLMAERELTDFRLESSSEAVEYWYLKDDQVVDHVFD